MNILSQAQASQNQRRSKLCSQRGKNAKNCAKSQYLTFNRYRLPSTLNKGCKQKLLG